MKQPHCGVCPVQVFWEPSSWRPDGVLILLGNNDFSTEPHPDDHVFTDAYLELLRQLRMKVSSELILHTSVAVVGRAR
jgi:hypothetical protein